MSRGEFEFLQQNPLIHVKQTSVAGSKIILWGCIVWCVQEIENLLNLVDPDEQWYEKDAPLESAVRITNQGIFTGVDLPNGAGSLVFNNDKVKSLDSKDLQGELQMNATAVRQPSDFLHHSFKQADNNAIELVKEEIS